MLSAADEPPIVSDPQVESARAGIDALERWLERLRDSVPSRDERVMLTALLVSLGSQLDRLDDEDLRRRFGAVSATLTQRVEAWEEVDAKLGRTHTHTAVQLAPAVAPAAVPARRRVASTVGAVLMAAGLAIALFFGYAFFGSGLSEQRSQKLLFDRFETSLTNGTMNYNKLPAPGDPVALLKIASIGLEQVVVEGTNPSATEQGPGHFRSSPLPGQVGNAVIAGRRSTYGAPFRDIGELAVGDEIVATTAEGVFSYDVTQIAHVHPGQQDVVAPTTDNRLTLVTSEPRFTPSGRLAVIATLQGKPVSSPAEPRPLAVGDDETGLRGDIGAAGPLILWLELLVLVGAGGVFLARRWSRWATYLLGAPVVLALLVLLFDSLNRLFPATL
jgi:sortase A